MHVNSTTGGTTLPLHPALQMVQITQISELMGSRHKSALKPFSI
jgi:hypothetical protein